MANRPVRKASAPIFHPFAAGQRKPRVDIAPSLLSCDFSEVGAELKRCKRFGARWIHVDIMDGHFVPNITFGPPVLKKWVAAQPDLFYDVHLMIDEPMRYAEKFAEAGAGMITVHIETLKQPKRNLRAIAKLGVKVGLTLKPKTPNSDILPLLEDNEVALVLVMTVEPGFGGQELIPKTLNKVRELDKNRRDRGLEYRLQVDGGINAETAGVAVAAGADVLVAGNAVFGNGSIRENLQLLKSKTLFQ